MKDKDTKAHFDKIYNLTSPLTESKESTIESDTDSSKPTKQTPSKNTSKVHGDDKW